MLVTNLTDLIQMSIAEKLCQLDPHVGWWNKKLYGFNKQIHTQTIYIQTNIIAHILIMFRMYMELILGLKMIIEDLKSIPSSLTYKYNMLP